MNSGGAVSPASRTEAVCCGPGVGETDILFPMPANYYQFVSSLSDGDLDVNETM